MVIVLPGEHLAVGVIPAKQTATGRNRCRGIVIKADFTPYCLSDVNLDDRDSMQEEWGNKKNTQSPKKSIKYDRSESIGGKIEAFLNT